MPGLQLTERQTHRLWGLDRATWEVVVDVLLSRHVLMRTARDAYVRPES